MIYLDATTKTLQLAMSAAPATTQPQITTFFYDLIPQATLPTRTRGGLKVTTGSGITDVNIVAAPGVQGTIRNIHTIFINNRDTAAITCIVKLDDNGTETIYARQILQIDETLVYEDGNGWSLVGGASNTPPFADTTAIYKGSADDTKRFRIEIDGFTTATTRVMTPPDADFTAVGLTNTQTLTNKTLTNPSIDTIIGAVVATQINQESASATNLVVSPGRQQFHPSAAKVWATADAAGALLGSYNMTSVTDDGIGTITFTWNTDFSSGNYACVATPESSTLAAACRIQMRVAGSIQVVVYNESGTTQDPDRFHIVVFGDQ